MGRIKSMLSGEYRLPNSGGDTIAEVMISMAILSFVIIISYSLSSRTFQTSLNAQYRDQAVNLGQQQLEILKEADNSLPATISNYKTPTVTSGTAFCINPNTKAVQSGSNDMISGSPAGCKVGKLFTVSVVYDSTSQTYRVTTKWDSSTGTPQQTDVYYKSSDSFNPNGVSISCVPPLTNPDLCASTQTLVPAISVSLTSPATGNPVSTVNVGDTVKVSWSSANVDLASCSAGGPGGFGGTNVKSNSGSYITTALNTVGNYNFTVDCNDNNGAAVNPGGSAPLAVISPAPIPTTASASSVGIYSATLNGNANPNGFPITGCGFYYDTTAYSNGLTSTPTHGSGVACDQTPASLGSGSTPPGPAVSKTVSLNPNTTYYYVLCIQNAYKYACGNNVSFTTNSIPPPVQVYFCEHINYNGSCRGPFGSGYNCDWVENCGIYNDWVSSMYFNTSSTTTVAIYWDINYGGSCTTLSGNAGNFVDFGWNDQMSSFKVGSGC